MKKISLLIVVALALGVFISVSCAQRESLDVGSKAPDFTLQDTASGRVNLQATLKTNNAALLVFWATWCPYCREEIPELKKLNAEYKGKGLKILAIDIGESQKKVASFVKDQGIEYTVLLDKDNDVANQYGVNGIPNNTLVDKDGTIKYRGNAPPPEDLLPKK